MTPDALAEGLNPQQRAAVLHRGGPLLVLAGAGSGKTRVITVRIAHLVATGTPADRVLALTFTNKAAGEMAERVAGLVGREAASSITVGTFHSLGLRMVEEEARRLGLSRPVTLLDAADQAVAVRQSLKQLRIDPRRHDPQTFLTGISNARNAGLSPDDLARQPGRRYTAAVYRKYIEWIRAHRCIDFDDLILLPVQMLREHPEVRDKWRARFRTILVDEYQDTNMMQLEMVRLLADEHRSLCVVGDDDQSIYGWRGACVENILQFERHFPDATVIALEQNYRSTGHILSAANHVIARNADRKDKRLWTDSGDGDPVRVVRCKDPRSEASFLAGEIHRMHVDEHRPWSHFGVLFRASSQASAVEEAFRLGGIPYRLVGAYNFYERKEIKDVLSYLRLMHNPRDRSGFVRVVNFPQRGIGPKRLASLMDFAAEHRMSPFRACAHADEIPGMARPQVEALKEFHEVVSRLGDRLEEGDGDLARIVGDLCEAIGARAAWIRDPTEGPGGHARWRHVEYLMEGMRRWRERNPDGDVGDFLKSVTLDRRNQAEDDHADAVTMMTVHGSKGLEWPVCFVIGCQEGSMPHQRTIDDGGDISEERRLFYVAITRARRRLFLTHSRLRIKFHGAEPARPSRFLGDIPDDHREDEDRSRGGGEPGRDETKQRFADLLDRLSG
ncbi:MAG: ATP-dependent helicase [Myxococcota bacterium]